MRDIMGEPWAPKSTAFGKHSKSFSRVDALSAGVDRKQRNFEPLRRQVEPCRVQQLTDATAKLILHQAFIEDEASGAACARAVLCAAARRLPNEDDLEAAECRYVGV